MSNRKRIHGQVVLIATVFIAVVLLLTGKPGNAYCEEQHQLSGSGGGVWLNQAVIAITEPIGLKRVDEPVEAIFTSDKSKPQGEDIRITDENYTEIPCQVSVTGSGTYKVSFFATVEPNSMEIYHLHFNNPHALKPDYAAMYSAVDNQAKTWQTDGLLIGWGGKAGFNLSDTNIITTLKFDHNGDKNPSNDLDCLTDDYAWDWFYGLFGSSTPGAFGAPEAHIIQNGPVYCEMALGGVKVRYYKDKKWLMAFNYIDSVDCFDRTYQFMKNGRGDEIFIPDWGSGDIPQGLTGYDSADTNPGYLAFRNPANGLIFGAVATDVARWFIHAKYSGAWDRTISFGNNSNRPDARVYWYADTSNNYNGIDQLSKQILNPLETSTIVDTDPPVTNISVTPEIPNGRDGWFMTPVEGVLSASEKSSTFYRFDTDPYAPYESTITVPEGIHSLYYYSIDTAGNWEEEKHARFKVDSNAPELNLSLSPANPDNFYLLNQGITFSFAATDAGAGITSILANVNGAPVYSGATATFNRMGRYTFDVVANDTVGHQTSKSESFYVGYDFKWLSPVKRKGRPEGEPYRTDAGLDIPIRFTVSDSVGRFVVDKSVRVVVSDSEHEAVFVYGKGRNNVKPNPCTRYYTLNIVPGSYPWLKPGGTYTISVYFGATGGSPGVCHGSITLELQ